MSDISLGALVCITKLLNTGRRGSGFVKGRKGIILSKETIMTNKGESVMYKVIINSTNRVITVAAKQVVVLGTAENDPEMFI